MQFGRLFIVLGLAFLIIGFVMVMGHRIPFLGKLSGDIHIERPNFHFYFPVMSCILLSLLFTLIFWLFKR